MIKCEEADNFTNHVELDGKSGELADQTLSIIKVLKDTISDKAGNEILWKRFVADAIKILKEKKNNGISQD
jgi:hypothetical protein